MSQNELATELARDLKAVDGAGGWPGTSAINYLGQARALIDAGWTKPAN